jgi:hypothetical protein
VRRALVVAFHFAPESTSGTHRLLHFARGLADGGIDVTVLTRSLESIDKADESLNEVFPWPDRIVRVATERTLLGGAVPRIKRLVPLPGRGSIRGANPDAVAVGSPSGGGPVPDSPLLPKRFARTRRLVDQIERFPDVHKGWFRPALRTGRVLFRRRPFDLVVASGPPWTALRVGAILAREHGVPLISDFRDPWTRLSGREGFSRGAGFNWLSERMESRVIGITTLTLTNSPGVAQAIAAGHPKLEPSRIATILNGSDARRRSREVAFPVVGDLVARHFGSLYAGRRIAPLVMAAASRRESGRSWLVEQYGDDPEEADLTDLSPSHRALLSICPTLPFTAAVERMHEPCVLVVIQPRWFARNVPTKLYDYLCTGNPILVLAPEDSSTWSLASQFERCHRADPDDSAGIAGVLEKLEEQRNSGELFQLSAIDDTDYLSKAALSREFVDWVRRAGR